MGSGEDSIIQGSGSKTNKQRFEALEENQDRIFKSLSKLTTSIAHLTRSNNDAIERLERQLAENKGKETIGGRTQGDGRRSRSSWREVEFSSGFKRGGRVERGPLMVEHWLHDEVFKGEMDDGSEEDVRLDRRPRDQRPNYGQRREPWRGAAEYEDSGQGMVRGVIIGDFYLRVEAVVSEGVETEATSKIDRSNEDGRDFGG
ncbi:hypothetical protein EZV62_027130 [Acer yangbiense]|uniref:Uncharacterized protein n=1 Tax=Acer yangbiense TaxID=1000413 RepID=A0A5C7GUQ2_9ROSI|nr:hypothetical protein EZV62_027130 [Acer yangbiense]